MPKWPEGGSLHIYIYIHIHFFGLGCKVCINIHD